MHHSARLWIHLSTICLFTILITRCAFSQSQTPSAQRRCEVQGIRERNTPEPPQDPESQLLRSIRLCDHERATALIQGGANVSFEDGTGNTPLTLAIGFDQTSIVQELLRHGAKPDQASSKTSLQTALMTAARNGNTGAARLLLVYGANPNKADMHGATALMYAAETGNTEVVKLLLSYGADPTLRDKSSKSARDSAMRAKHGEIADILNSAAKKARDGTDPVLK